MPNTDSNGYYLRYCRAKGIKEHPARYPSELPEFFIRMLTDEGASVLDPFAGSCATGEVCERLKRRWVCVELDEQYLRGAIARFKYEELVDEQSDSQPRLLADTERENARNGREEAARTGSLRAQKSTGRVKYSLWRPGALWGKLEDSSLAADGGRHREKRRGVRPADAGSENTER